jgi:hypothetical protein
MEEDGSRKETEHARVLLRFYFQYSNLYDMSVWSDYIYILGITANTSDMNCSLTISVVSMTSMWDNG